MSTQEIVLLQDTQVSTASHTGRRINAASVYIASLDSRESQRVMSSYLSVVARYIGSVHKQPVSSFLELNWGVLRRAEITTIMAKLKESGRMPATINTYMYALKGVAREAWALKQMDVDDFQHIMAIRPVRGSRLGKGRPLPDEEMTELLMTCEADRSEIGVRDHAMIQVLLGAGLRRTELVTLDLEHINLKTGVLHAIGKGNKERQAHLPGNALKAVKYWVSQVRGEDEGPLFCRIRKGGDVTGERLSSQSVWFILEKRCLEAGIPVSKPHDLRRTFASLMLETGSDLVTVRDAMGHASVETTQRYIIKDDEDMRHASERINSKLSTARKPARSVTG